MATAKRSNSGGGFFSKFVVVAFLAIAIALYLKVLSMDTERAAQQASAPQASVIIVESDAAGGSAATLVALPEDQQVLIMQVFAPELIQGE